MNKLFKKIDKASDVSRKEGSGRSKSVSTEKNIELVEEMILSQSQRIIDPKPANHSTTAMTAHELHFEKKDKKDTATPHNKWTRFLTFLEILCFL